MWYQLNSLLCQFVRFCSKLEHVVLGCVWISLILLKTKNNKKIISKLLFTQKILFICLFALFMSHEQYKRCWSFKKRKKKREKKRSQKHICVKMQTQSKRYLSLSCFWLLTGSTSCSYFLESRTFYFV